ncbi:MAG: hypothetical protein WAM79_23530 [Candidatus Sulfotelmatobacter sp.]
MSVPDLISPIVGYRVWTWGTLGLKSLCGERWHPSQSLAARCRASTVVGPIVGRSEAADDHDAPQANCTCGIYAVKTLHHFRSAGYEQFGIYGEVYLWGTVVEHELGWRAQFAYPKNLFLSPDTLPFTLTEIQVRLRLLVAYGIHIFVADANGNIPLWTKHSGLNPAGLDYLIGIGKEYYVRRQRDRILKRGDRVAILGRGIAVVERVKSGWIQAVVLNKCTLRIARNCIRWDEQNMRWETSPHACVETTSKV